MTIRDDDLSREEARIAAVYARRAAPAVRGRYSHFNSGYLFTLQQRQRRVLRVLEQEGFQSLEEKRILEVGCGGGQWIRDLIQWGARPENLAGVDLLPDSIAEASVPCPAGVTLRCASAADIDFPDGQFDLVLQSTVFTSVLDERLKRQIAREMLRVLQPDGMILWYDFLVNNPWNPDVRGVKKREIRGLFAGCRVRLKRITLAPPIARRLARYGWTLCCLLEKIPLLCTHYLGAIRKGPGD
jgi:ubiquinone/menaquinone biosynthesis C-methylase UbiE